MLIGFTTNFHEVRMVVRFCYILARINRSRYFKLWSKSIFGTSL